MSDEPTTTISVLLPDDMPDVGPIIVGVLIVVVVLAVVIIVGVLRDRWQGRQDRPSRSAR